MKKLLIFFLACVVFLGVSSLVAADFGVTLPNPLCLNNGANGSPCVSDFNKLTTQVGNYISGSIAAIASIVLVYAGLLFVTSAGSPDKVAKAKQALIYAIIGIVVILSVQGLMMVLNVVFAPPTPCENSFFSLPVCGGVCADPKTPKCVIQVGSCVCR